MSPPRETLKSGWAVQARSIHALILRNLMLRYGRDNIGFLWVVLEPMILTAGVMIIWSLLGSDKQGIKMVELVLTGYMPLTLWRHMTNSCVTLFRSNSSLLYHRRVSLFDIVAARLSLEFIGTTAALLIVCSALNIAGLAGDIQRYDLFILGWLMMAWISGGAGLVVAAATEVSETWERFVQPVQYLMIPISGAFFLVDWLPGWAQQLILYHPLVHCYEAFRAGFFGEAIVTNYDVGYFSLCAVAMIFAGILSVAAVRRRVQLN